MSQFKSNEFSSVAFSASFIIGTRVFKSNVTSNPSDWNSFARLCGRELDSSLLSGAQKRSSGEGDVRTASRSELVIANPAMVVEESKAIKLEMY